MIAARRALAYWRCRRAIDAERELIAPGALDAPTPTFTQAELRERRRKRLFVIDGDDFDLAAEVCAITWPLAARVAAAPRPTVYCAHIDEVAVATHELARTVVGLLTERDARRKTANLPVESRHAVQRNLDRREVESIDSCGRCTRRALRRCCSRPGLPPRPPTAMPPRSSFARSTA